MRGYGVIVALAAVAGLAGCGHTAPSGTEVNYVVAVDADGLPTDGYRETRPAGNVTAVSDCGASPAAVSADIYACAPSAAGADVCWSSTTGSLLCLADPWGRELHRVTVERPPAATAPGPLPRPLALELDDGTRCRLRNGGAWGGRDDDYLGAYSCADTPQVVLEKDGEAAVDRSTPRWTVRLGELGAEQTHFPAPTVHQVRAAWFAGRRG